MANKIKFGIRNAYYAKATPTTGGALSYSAPVAMPGAVALNLDQVGENEPFYADDVVYFQSQSNNGYSGTFELALIPESFRTDILGEITENDGVIVEKADVQPAEFALLFEFQGDDKATRHALFRCQASRPSVTGNTKQANITPDTETLNITVMPRISDQVVKAKCPYSASTAYSAWFTSVYSV